MSQKSNERSPYLPVLAFAFAAVVVMPGSLSFAQQDRIEEGTVDISLEDLVEPGTFVEDDDAPGEAEETGDDGSDFFDSLEIIGSESQTPQTATVTVVPGDNEGLDLDLLEEETEEVEVGSLNTLESEGVEAFDEFETRWGTGVFRGLDKITARVSVFEGLVDTPVEFGRFEVLLRECNKKSPEETPHTTAFVEIIENTLDGERVPVFGGWMFAESPGLSAVEHPVYDIWLIDCKMSDAVAVIDIDENMAGDEISE